MAVTYIVLLSCLAYGAIAYPPTTAYLSQNGAGSAAYRPVLPAVYGSVHGGHNSYNGFAGRPISSVGIDSIGPISSGSISSGYQHGRVYQQVQHLPVHGAVIGQQSGAPIGIGYSHSNAGYHHGIAAPVSSGYSHHVLPSKYAHVPY